MVKVYYIDINDYLNININLPDNINERPMKYKQDSDILRSKIGWYLLNKYLLDDFKIDLSKFEIKENAYHKPYIDYPIYFNITHSNNIVAVGIANQEIGCDVEECNNKIKHQTLAKKILSDEDLTIYYNTSNKLDYFVSKWTEKEAIFKKIGTGINFKEFKEIKDKVITLKILDSNNTNYYLSVAVEDNIDITIENKTSCEG